MSETKIRDWDFKGVNTKYSTHGIHYYPARMIPQIANKLLILYSKPKDLILDPFCGSGTVILESNILKRYGIGFDINPLALLISRVKTSKLDNDNEKAIEFLLKKIKSKKNLGDLNQYSPKFKNLNYWFTDKSIRDLLIIKYHIYNSNYSLNFFNFLLICFSKTVNEVFKGTFDGSSTHLRKNLQDFSPNTFKIFEKNVRISFKILSAFSKIENNSKSWLLPGDSRKMPLKNDTIDCIITSPPYGEEENTIGYMRWTKFSLYWLGYSPDELIKLKKLALGSINKNKEFLESDYLLQFFKNLELPEKRINYLKTFYKDYFLCFREMYRVLKPDKFCCIVIGNRRISKKPLFMDKITLEIAGKIGFKSIKTLYRHIPTKAIPWIGVSGKTIKKENIIILKKIKKSYKNDDFK
ncbi:MAG: DNA methyltransferase [Candidatus Helarchaeota archaeon]